MNGSKLTNASEIAAYLTAHVVGIGATYLINPLIFAALVVDGYQPYIPAVALGMSVVTMTVVLLLFLFMRKAMGE